MKKILSLMIIGFVTMSFVPLANAAVSEEQRQLINTQREIRQQLRAPQSSRLSDLKLELQSIQKNLRDLRLQERQERRKLGLKPVSIAITPITISPSETTPQVESGKASYYGPALNGNRTASGEIFNDSLFTAAHRTLPFGTKVKVINPTNGKSIEVVINDRGPFVAGRIIDLSSAAFSGLDNLSRGVIDVQVEIIDLAK